MQQAYDIIQFAPSRDIAPAENAVRVLVAGTGETQPEIIADLDLRPPDYSDARARLLALLNEIARPASTSDPALAQQRLHQVMSMSRYDALHRPQSLFDRVVQWITDRIDALMRLLFGGRGGTRTPLWILYGVLIATLIAIAVVVFRVARGRFSDGMASPPPGPRAAADYFAVADRLAGRDDRVGAVRALCAGVAATLAGEWTWAGSPLTVREIFQRAPDSASLEPLLLPFEAAGYGGRDVDQLTYTRAAQVAAVYRHPLEAVA